MNYATLWKKQVPFDHLVGKTIETIEGLEQGSDEIRIKTTCGNEYLMYHDQDCCESVYLSDYELYCNSLIGATVLSAEERASDASEEDVYESGTWTFYELKTDKGDLWLRWLGTSNGYYSESVDFVWLNKPEE